MNFRVLFVAAMLCALSNTAPALGENMVPTGDIAKRRLQKSDFPRWEELTSNVYAYEDSHGFIDEE